MSGDEGQSAHDVKSKDKGKAAEVDPVVGVVDDEKPADLNGIDMSPVVVKGTLISVCAVRIRVE